MPPLFPAPGARRRILVAATMLLTVSCSSADAQTITAFNRGWASAAGGRTSNSSIQNYVAQNSFSSGSTTRNFFEFNVGSIGFGSWATSAQLQLSRASSGGATGTYNYTVREVTSNTQTASGFALYADAGSGDFYGSTGVSFSGTTTSPVFLTLNSAAILDINAANLTDDRFAVGGVLSSPSSPTTWRFGNSASGSFFTRLALNRVVNTNPNANLDDESIDSGDSVTFNGAGTDSDAVYGDSIASYQFDIDNDGTFDYTQASSSLTLTGAELASFGLVGGDYDIGFRVTDQWGATGFTTGSLSIAAVPEPGSFAVLAMMAVPFALRRRRREVASV